MWRAGKGEAVFYPLATAWDWNIVPRGTLTCFQTLNFSTLVTLFLTCPVSLSPGINNYWNGCKRVCQANCREVLMIIAQGRLGADWIVAAWRTVQWPMKARGHHYPNSNTWLGTGAQDLLAAQRDTPSGPDGLWGSCWPRLEMAMLAGAPLGSLPRRLHPAPVQEDTWAASKEPGWC